MPLSIFLAVASVGPPSIAEPSPSWPARAVVLVVAGWCAPCHEELGRLDAIAAAAGEREVRVVGFDQSAPTRAMLARVPAARRWLPGPGEQPALRSAVYAASAGLPYAAATDARGRICADLTQPLDAVRTRALVARCRD